MIRWVLSGVLLIGAAAQAQEAAEDLRGPLELTESIPVSITRFADAVTEPEDVRLVVWALDDWSRALGGRLRFHLESDESEARIRVRFVPPAAGQYGEAFRIRVGDRRGAVLHVRSDVRALGRAFSRRAARDPLFRHTIVYLTLVHEMGHALGLGHTANFSDIMYAFGFGGDIEEYFLRYRRKLESFEDIETTSVLSRGDRTTVRAFYSIE